MIPQYRLDVDGLRAIAVSAVVLFHVGVPGISGGFVGVDVFFVISGYLITSILVSDLDGNRFSVARFYERRARRILPALFFTLAVTSIAAAILLLPPDYAAFCRSLIASLSFVANIYFWLDAGYFAAGADTKPLLHLWSLAVEEQFYLGYPILLFVVFKYARRAVLPVLVLLLITSFAISVWTTMNRPGVAFYLLPSRAWELLLGAVVAVWPLRSPKGLTSDVLTAGGLALIAFGVASLDSDSSFPGLNAASPCVGSALVIYAGKSSSVARFLLCSAPIVWIGQISYSLYLFHWPAIVFAKYYLLRDLATPEKVLLVVLLIGAASVSLIFLENPARRQAKLFNRLSVFASSAIAISLFAALGIVGTMSAGWPGRFPGYDPRNRNDASISDYGTETCFIQKFSDPDAWNEEACRLTSNGAPTRVVLWGDSYAAQYAPGFVRAAKDLKFDLWQLTAAQCLPTFHPKAYDRCNRFTQHALDTIRMMKPSGVIMVGKWATYPQAMKDLGATIATISSYGVRPLVIGQSALFNFKDPYALLYREKRINRGGNYYSLMNVNKHFNYLLQRAASNAYFVDPLPLLCTPTSCDIERDGNLLYLDNGHLSSFGSEILVRSIAPQLNKYFVQP